MATFAKYVAPQVPRTDWGAITRGLSTGLQKVYQEREAEKQELDKLEMDAAAEVNNTEMGKSQTFNEFTLKGINTTKDYMASQNKLLKQGLITPAQYKLNILRAQEGWQTFANNAETFNKDYADFLDRLDKGEASSLEEFARENYLSLTDLTNKQIYVNPVDGNVYIAKVDPKTGQVMTDGLMDVKTINNALNQKVTKLNLAAAVNDYVKVYGKYGGKDPITGKYVLSGIDLNKKDEILNTTTDAILANSKAVASVLLDNTKGYRAVSPETYASLSPEEKRKAVVVKPNAQGVFTPEITDELMSDARQIVKDAIMAQVDYQEEAPLTAAQKASLALQRESLNLQRQALNEKKAQGYLSGQTKQELVNQRVRNINSFLANPTDPKGSFQYIKGADIPNMGILTSISQNDDGTYKVMFSKSAIVGGEPNTASTPIMYTKEQLRSLYNQAANLLATDDEFKISMDLIQGMLGTKPLALPQTGAFPTSTGGMSLGNTGFGFEATGPAAMGRTPGLLDYVGFGG